LKKHPIFYYKKLVTLLEITRLARINFKRIIINSKILMSVSIETVRQSYGESPDQKSKSIENSVNKLQDITADQPLNILP
jgi:hypothetical protein